MTTKMKDARLIFYFSEISRVDKYMPPAEGISPDLVTGVALTSQADAEVLPPPQHHTEPVAFPFDERRGLYYLPPLHLVSQQTVLEYLLFLKLVRRIRTEARCPVA